MIVRPDLEGLLWADSSPYYRTVCVPLPPVYHGPRRGRRVEVQPGSLDPVDQDCYLQILSIGPHLLEFLQPQIPSWSRDDTVSTNRR